jgi:signal transduction histidine kinase
MQFFRNREIKRFTLLLTVIAVVTISIGFCISTVTGFTVLITVFLLCFSFYCYTFRRYQKIGRLSQYLTKISSGDYFLDIRDNSEGELSILKNEIYKVTLMLTEYNEQLKKEKLLLSEQMAEISHQLKTPLTSMMVMVDLLREDELPASKRSEFTSLINTQLIRMEWLVSSLLKMSKLDAGVIVMKSDKIPAAKLFQNALKPFLITMELKEISCSVNDGGYFITCDPEWTTEAVINIIKNAIEHSQNGGQLELTAQDNPLYTELMITDHGTGISKEDLPHIFTRFYRGKNASKESVGIGLAMSYRIIRNQQGDIQVRSEVGKGSTFSIRLYKSVV